MALQRLDDFGGEHLGYMFLNELPVLETSTVWLLTKRTCTKLQLNLLGNYFDLTEVARAHLLVEFQHGKYSCAIVFFLYVRKVNNVASIVFRLSCFGLTVNARIFRRDDRTRDGRCGRV